MVRSGGENFLSPTLTLKPGAVSPLLTARNRAVLIVMRVGIRARVFAILNTGEFRVISTSGLNTSPEGFVLTSLAYQTGLLPEPSPSLTPQLPETWD